ncbi:Mth938-like domain-containing protein [Undibacterium sp.]|uniref:Mth938-like domain-containing protein n=1 Tax=Undibacterium sp. TaxID=1914977 RepID=UPI003752729E
MKLHATNTQQYQTVTAYDDEGVEFNLIRYEHSLIVLPETAPTKWDVKNFEDLSASHFEQVAATAPDVVILGTGKRQKFIHPKLIAALSAQHKGVECMDNQAACRTYNILMTEGRKVALALILEKA